MIDAAAELLLDLKRDEALKRASEAINCATRAQWALAQLIPPADKKETLRGAGLNVAWFDEVADVVVDVSKVPAVWQGMPGTWGAVERSEVPAFKSSVADYGVRVASRPARVQPSVDVAARRCYFDD